MLWRERTGERPAEEELGRQGSRATGPQGEDDAAGADLDGGSREAEGNSGLREGEVGFLGAGNWWQVVLSSGAGAEVTGNVARGCQRSLGQVTVGGWSERTSFRK